MDEKAIRIPAPSIRMGTISRKPWVKASGPDSILKDKATFYLVQEFDYKTYRLFDKPETILAKVVCKLRHYFCQSQQETVRLIQQYFNPKSDYQWSAEGISLMWEVVKPFTPDLGLRDEDARSKQRMDELEDDVIDLIAYTRAGGRTSISKLLGVLMEWYPEREVDPRVFGKVVKSITGIPSKPSNGDRIYEGFHLPTAEEREDTNHFIGIHPSQLEAVSSLRQEEPAA